MVKYYSIWPHLNRNMFWRSKITPCDSLILIKNPEKHRTSKNIAWHHFHALPVFFVCLFFSKKRTSAKNVPMFPAVRLQYSGLLQICEVKCPWKGRVVPRESPSETKHSNLSGEALIFLEGEKNGERRNFQSPKSWACGAPGSESTTVMFQWVFHPPTPISSTELQDSVERFGGSWETRFVTTKNQVSNPVRVIPRGDGVCFFPCFFLYTMYDMYHTNVGQVMSWFVWFEQ